jgi:hypothetical protein
MTTMTSRPSLPYLFARMSRIRAGAHRHEAGRRTDDGRRAYCAAGFAPMTVYPPRHKATLLRQRIASPIL